MTGIAEKELADFQAFERWLHQERLLDSDVLYRGHGDSTWSLESTLYRHRRALFPPAHPALRVPVAGYADAARNLQAIVETHTNRNFSDIVKSEDPFPIDDAGLSFRYAVYLRHHGFPSPLLDWSLSPLRGSVLRLQRTPSPKEAPGMVTKTMSLAWRST